MVLLKCHRTFLGGLKASSSVLFFQISKMFIDENMQEKWGRNVENEIIVKRRVNVDSRGSVRLTIPKALAQGLGLKDKSEVGIVWKGSHLQLVPWPVQL